jgi:S-adenosylmethionine:tRNA ribosyltransferase-isomerase
MRAADFDYALPPELIAQHPAPARDHSQLLVLDRNTGALEHRRFFALPEFLRAGDILVLNDSRVIPARLRGVHATTGSPLEILLLEENSLNDWWAMLRPGKRARDGTKISLLDPEKNHSAVSAVVAEINAEGHRRLKFSGTENILHELERLGEVPLPPYIERPQQSVEDRDRYQTVYAGRAGSVAAPTAGLHFTTALLEQIRALGVEVCAVTLHVGLGTFAPVKTELISQHTLHTERFEISPSAARSINAARSTRRRIIAVGTTTARVLESVAASSAQTISAGAGRTNIFIHPPFQFKIIDGLLTNFHLPRSTLLMLVSAFAAPGEVRGREIILSAYAEAVRRRYRVFSYGDAMLIL